LAPLAAQVADDAPAGTTITDPNSYTGPTTVDINPALGTGTVVLTGGATGNTYTGYTHIDAGTLQAGVGTVSAGAFSPNSDFTLYNGSTVDLNGNNETVASIASTDAATTITNSGNGPATLTVDDTNSSLAPVTYAFAGQITDPDAADALSIIKDGTGVLILGGSTAGNNNYHGATTINGGTIQAAVDSGTDSAFSDHSDYVLTGTGTLDTNGNAETIASLSSASTTAVVTNSGNGDGTLTINDGNSSTGGTHTYEGVITDAGTGNRLSIVKDGPGTEIFLGANTYSGGTTIGGGTLIVGNLNGSHVSTALGTGNVSNAGTLETTAGTTAVALNAEIGGSFSQSSSGTLVVQVVSTPSLTPNYLSGVKGTDYDTYTVAGSASPGGELDLHFQALTLPSEGQRFDVLTAGSHISTTFVFPTVTNLPAPYFTVTTYDDTFGGVYGSEPANSVVVTLVKPFTSYGDLTPNQKAVAANVDANLVYLNDHHLLAFPGGAYKDFFNNVVTGLNVATYHAGALGSTLDELSPQRYEILRNIAFDNYAMDMTTLDDEFARERDNMSGGMNMAGFSLNDHALGATLSEAKGHMLAWEPAPEHGLLNDSALPVLGGVEMTDSKDMKNCSQCVPTTNQLWNTFIDGGADLGDLQNNQDESHTSYTTGRVRLGADYLVAQNVRVGALLAYSHTDSDLDNEGSTAEVDSYTPGLFATYADQHGFYGNAVFTGSLNEYTTHRNVLVPGFQRYAQGDTTGEQYGIDIGGGKEWHWGGLTFGPSVGLSYVNLQVDDFDESGGYSTNLHVNDWSSESLRSRIGGTARFTGRFCGVAITPHFSGYWQHEFLDGNQNITSNFEYLPVGSFTVNSPQGDRDTALLDAGVDAQVSGNVGVFLDYTTEVGGPTYFGQSATGGVKVSF
jgi:autotransporter-associated beta strand protein